MAAVPILSAVAANLMQRARDNDAILYDCYQITCASLLVTAMRGAIAGYTRTVTRIGKKEHELGSPAIR